jgi:hypothetical protein
MWNNLLRAYRQINIIPAKTGIQPDDHTSWIAPKASLCGRLSSVEQISPGNRSVWVLIYY